MEKPDIAVDIDRAIARAQTVLALHNTMPPTEKGIAGLIADVLHYAESRGMTVGNVIRAASRLHEQEVREMRAAHRD